MQSRLNRRKGNPAKTSVAGVCKGYALLALALLAAIAVLHWFVLPRPYQEYLPAALVGVVIFIGGMITGWFCSDKWGRGLVADAASYAISYPSAEFGEFYLRLSQAPVLVPGPPLPFRAVWAAAFLVIGLMPYVFLRSTLLLRMAAAGLIMAAVALGLFLVSFAAVGSDYRQAFLRASLLSYAGSVGHKPDRRDQSNGMTDKHGG